MLTKKLSQSCLDRQNKKYNTKPYYRLWVKKTQHRQIHRKWTDARHNRKSKFFLQLCGVWLAKFDIPVWPRPNQQTKQHCTNKCIISVWFAIFDAGPNQQAKQHCTNKRINLGQWVESKLAWFLQFDIKLARPPNFDEQHANKIANVQDAWPPNALLHHLLA